MNLRKIAVASALAAGLTLSGLGVIATSAAAAPPGEIYDFYPEQQDCLNDVQWLLQEHIAERAACSWMWGHGEWALYAVLY
ncbi:hypothetical protein Cs7R123_00500 [Catellatospora sp. TT07R-123]|uniref:hypothetical protein n=1 Tax=Catellatospora sp. TT07R-123 TaxID=2733863 RepID=UPI001B082E38|nr:hypothetical protein [Catellatospora sp. TT07R-123]GHJ42708.1 hypothetical protein Cs7R123_00500 [Catellatospora sp. TT07R-123]